MSKKKNDLNSVNDLRNGKSDHDGNSSDHGSGKGSDGNSSDKHSA